LGYQLGSDALLVLLHLAARATDSSDGMLVALSYRDVARRLGISKDTVGRRLHELSRRGVLVERSDDSCGRFDVRVYALNLELVGVTREPGPVAA
jgi:DNA-binding Lrp family transcriptional regulator